MTKILGTGRARGALVGVGPLARAGLSRVLFCDGAVGVGITQLSVMDAVWSVATTVGGDHHLVYSYVPLCVSFEGHADRQHDRDVPADEPVPPVTLAEARDRPPVGAPLAVTKGD